MAGLRGSGMNEPSPTPPIVSGESSPRQITREELLNLREKSWAPRMRNASLVAEAEIRVEYVTQVANALGRLYGRLPDRHETGVRFLLRWPACVAAAMVGAAVSGYEAGTYWRALWEAAKYPGSVQDQTIWGQAFVLAIERLGMATFPGMPLRYVGPILMHAGIPAYCLGDYFRMLLERHRRDPGMDAESFLAWATSPRRESRLFELDVPARRFISNGGEYAHDVVDRSLDLLERLSEPDPDLNGIRLPAYVVDAARAEVEAGRLDLSVAHRRITAAPDRYSRPSIGLDPFGEGIQVILPAVGETPDGMAFWRVTADGEAATVQSRALWVGTTEAAPATSYPLPRPVRAVLVSLVGRDLTVELQVIEPTDPVLFFADDGRQLSGSQSLPRGQVWILHPRDRELAATGDLIDLAEPSVPFGWEGWRLRLVSLDNVQAVSLTDGRSHHVHGQARPRLLLGEPVSGVTTPYGSPVYALPPAMWLPGSAETPISWHVDIRPAAGGPPLVSLDVDGPSEVDPWRHLLRPLLGAFEVTVRGPLGRGMRRTIFVAERLSVSYQPSVRALAPDGLRPSEAALTAAIGAAVRPRRLRFEPSERAHVTEYRVADETEPLVVTPPHVTLLCSGAGAATWTAAPLHLTTEAFSDAERLLVRVPGAPDPADLQVWVGGAHVQSIPASGQRTPGLAGYELARCGDTIAAHGRAELILPFASTSMLVGFVRPRRVASGADLDGDQLRLRDYRHVDGLLAGIYLVYAPWRHPVHLPVSADGVAVLPDELRSTGPLRVVLRVEDPWTTTSWPLWPGSDSYSCEALGIPAGNDPEEDALSGFLAGARDMPEPLRRLDRLWQLIHVADDLIRSGARRDLAERCGNALRSQPKAALLALLETGLDHRACVTALIVTGLAALQSGLRAELAAPDQPDQLAEVAEASQLWAALPVAAAILTGDLLPPGSVATSGPLAVLADDAIAQCGETLRMMLRGQNDPLAGVGRFGPDAERMAALSTAQVEALWQAAAVVPQALLDADTRMAAARQLFDARRTPEFRRAAMEAASVMNAAQGLIRASRYPSLIRQLVARRHPEGSGGWLAVPAMSAALALVARLAARGDGACRSHEWVWRELWAGLASRAPDQAGIDLVLAEALVAGAANARMAKESG